MEHHTDVVLVTGGSGLLGSHVVNALVATGRFRVIATSRSPPQYSNPRAQHITSDIMKHDEMAAMIEKFKPIAIVHTVTPGLFAPASLHDSDHAATINLVEIARRSAFVKALVYTSSAEAMTNVSGAYAKPLTETDAILYTWESVPSAYALAKSASDAFVLQANGPGLATAVLRLLGMYGPRENKKTGIAASFMRVANAGVTRIQLGSDSVRHECVHVANAAHAHVLAIDALLDPQRHTDGEAFFITDGAPMKLWNCIRRVWAAVGNSNCNRQTKIVIPWWFLLALAGTIEFVFRIFTLGRKSSPLTLLHIHYMKGGASFDIKKAQGRLGYESLLSTEEGIEETVAWFRQTSMMTSAQQRVVHRAGCLSGWVDLCRCYES